MRREQYPVILNENHVQSGESLRSFGYGTGWNDNNQSLKIKLFRAKKTIKELGNEQRD